MPGDERQHTALAVERQTVSVRDDLNRVDGPARQAIDGVEQLERANQIELINRRHDDHDDSAGSPGSLALSTICPYRASRSPSHRRRSRGSARSCRIAT